MYYTTKRAIRLSWRQDLLFAVHDEVNVLFAVLLQVADQLVEVPVKGEALHHWDIEHVGQAGVPDGENLSPGWSQSSESTTFLQRSMP